MVSSLGKSTIHSLLLIGTKLVFLNFWSKKSALKCHTLGQVQVDLLCVGARLFHPTGNQHSWSVLQLQQYTAATTIYCSWYNFCVQHNKEVLINQINYM
jgi:hypothetical protein